MQYNANFIHIIHNAKKFKHYDRLVIVRYNWIYLVIFSRLNLKDEGKVECDLLSQEKFQWLDLGTCVPDPLRFKLILGA